MGTPAGKFLVYGLTDPRTNHVRYIGKSSRGLARPKDHQRSSFLAKDRTYKGNWIRELQRCGLSYGVVVFEECEGEDLNYVECFWIAQGNGLGWPLTNLTPGGDGLPFGFKQSSESIQKRIAKTTGKKRTPEQIERLRLGNLGKKHTDEAKAKMVEAARCRKNGPEEQLKWSLAAKAGWAKRRTSQQKLLPMSYPSV